MTETNTNTKINFKLFIVLWNQMQNMTTPALHLRMASWLEDAWINEDKRLLLMAFRSAGKSTLVGLFCAWLLYNNPNLRILVLAADFTLSKKMVRNVKRIIELHPLTHHMKPTSVDQWASDRFTVERELEQRDPSMMAKGISSNITGSRADIIICDDVEVPNTSDSDQKRVDLREKLDEMSYVLIAGGTQLYVGTPHHYYSIYADQPRTEIGEDTTYLDGFNRLSLPILDDNGNSIYPEKYPAETIELIKREAGPNKFDSQMMLKAVNIMEGRLNPDLLESYPSKLEYVKELNEMYIGHNKMVSASCWWDPSLASARGDNSVCAFVFTDMGGDYYLHHMEYIKISNADELNEVMQQSIIVANLLKKYHIPSISVETNGIGGAFPKVLMNALAKINCPCRVIGKHTSINKDTRILEGFDAIMAAHRLHVHDSIKDTPFIMEMREWRPQGHGKRSTMHDDGLDAVAGALSMHPCRLDRQFGTVGGFTWQKSANTSTAKSEFDV